MIRRKRVARGVITLRDATWTDIWRSRGAGGGRRVGPDPGADRNLRSRVPAGVHSRTRRADRICGSGRGRDRIVDPAPAVAGPVVPGAAVSRLRELRRGAFVGVDMPSAR